ncbi:MULTISPECIES: sigma D regulator [Salinicola]|uniref:Anti-RNA polymerase sigma 70 factor n=1 Tax=Salinicola socius TaxID=404433 RepID=A0A1Q8SNV3_9GAMM|nr:MULTISPECIES: sigma D regulator [Salinicola]OLO03066.1 anti-RNA polymerase sigma 70 factor [Salinicola socius]
MLEDCKTAQERWGGVHTLIDRWLDQRHDMLVTLVDLREFCDGDLSAVSKERIDAFSEALMDYISAGHFEIYPQLREEARAFDDREALDVADKLLARVDASTQMVLDFDNEYATPARCQRYTDRLPGWLDKLGATMTERFALEDQLISRLHAVHAPSAADVAKAPDDRSVRTD